MIKATAGGGRQRRGQGAAAVALRRAVQDRALREARRGASEFDGIHSVQRAQKVGSVHHIIPPERLRPYLIEAIQRGIARALGDRGTTRG
jgi:hypothetical protein